LPLWISAFNRPGVNDALWWRIQSILSLRPPRLCGEFLFPGEGKDFSVMKLLLVKTPFYSLFGVNVPKMKTYPLNLLYLATFVRDVGSCDAEIIDGENFSNPDLKISPEQDPEVAMRENIPQMIETMENPDHPIWQDMIAAIMAKNPDLVGITCNSVNMDSARILTGKLKKKGITVVLGGSHPSVLPAESIQYTGADMAIAGEGEQPLIELIRSIESKSGLAGVPSLAWRNGDEIVVNPKASLYPDIDELPIPDRSLVNRTDYFGEVVMTGRGCPFDCAYCASRNIWGRQVRLRSVSSIIEELETLRADVLRDAAGSTKTVVKFIDDTFTLGKKRTLDLLQEIIDRNFNEFEFTGGVRADTLDGALVEKMAEANFKRVTLGVESGSPKILEMIRKKETNADVTRALKLLREVGIRSHAFFMIGLPDESLEDIELSKRLILDARPDYVEVNMLTPYPGTDLFQRLIKKDPAKVDRWYRWFHQGLATHSQELAYDLDIAYREFAEFACQYNETH
jgi:anaerobic magnesium-protoporphyrin IX monomethyl ester cyclase